MNTRMLQHLARAIALLTLAAASSGVARADDDRTTARVLFDEGRKLMKAGAYASACPKLEEARKLVTSAGILLNLADCHEKTGRTATAWAEFGEAMTVALRSERREEAAEAKRRKQALEPGLVRLAVQVPHEPSGLTVTRDGLVLDRATWGAAQPVDPGSHEVRAEAAGFTAWSTTVATNGAGQSFIVQVPELQPVPAATAPPAAPEVPVAVPSVPAKSEKPFAMEAPADAGHHSSHVLPWALMIGGTVVGLTGGAFMIAGSLETNPPENPDRVMGTTHYWIGVAEVAAGVLATATGITLRMTDHGDRGATSRGNLTLSPWVGAAHGQGGGLRLGGAF